jgi:hypothetical protein
MWYLSQFFRFVKVNFYTHARGVSSVLSRFASAEDMFSVREKVNCVLLLAQLKSYTRVRCKFLSGAPEPNSTDLQICDAL